MFFVLIRFGVIWFCRTKIYGIYITLLIVDLLMHAGCWGFVFLNCWCPGVHCCWWTLLLVPWCWCTLYTVVGALVCRQAWQQGGKWRKPVAIACETRQLYCARLCFYFAGTCQATLLRLPFLGGKVSVRLEGFNQFCLLKRYHYQTTLLHWPSPSRGYYGHGLTCACMLLSFGLLEDYKMSFSNCRQLYCSAWVWFPTPVATVLFSFVVRYDDACFFEVAGSWNLCSSLNAFYQGVCFLFLDTVAE